MSPQRIQLSRKAGFRLPLGAKSVARPHKYGNPFRIKGPYVIEPAPFHYSHYCQPGEQRGVAVRLFREALLDDRLGYCGYPDLATVITDLAGLALACWCPLPESGQPDVCHARVLLDLIAEATT